MADLRCHWGEVWSSRIMEEASIRRLPLHAGGTLDTVDLASLERSHWRGRPIVRQGEPCGRLFLIRSGVVRESSVSPSGREVVLGLWGPGQVFGRLPPLVTLPSPTYARALTECRVIGLGPPELRTLLTDRPASAAALMAAISDRARRLAENLDRTLGKDVPGRVLDALRSLARDHGRPCPEGAVIDLAPTHEDLAGIVA